MRSLRFLAALACAALLALPAIAQGLRPREGDLKVGDLVPALKLPDVSAKSEVALDSLRGKPVVLIFGSCT